MEGDSFLNEKIFFPRIPNITGERSMSNTLTSEVMLSWMCVRRVGRPLIFLVLNWVPDCMCSVKQIHYTTARVVNVYSRVVSLFTGQSEAGVCDHNQWTCVHVWARSMGTGRVRSCKCYLGCHIHANTLFSWWIQPDDGVCGDNQWTCVHVWSRSIGTGRVGLGRAISTVIYT